MATCPAGHESTSWTSGHNQGREAAQIRFSTTDCRPCPLKARCTRSARRLLTPRRFADAAPDVRAEGAGAAGASTAARRGRRPPSKRNTRKGCWVTLHQGKARLKLQRIPRALRNANRRFIIAALHTSDVVQVTNRSQHAPACDGGRYAPPVGRPASRSSAHAGSLSGVPRVAHRRLWRRAPLSRRRSLACERRGDELRVGKADRVGAG